MKPLSSGLKKVLAFTLATIVISLGYYIYARIQYPAIPERETFLTELGEGIGAIGLWDHLYISDRTENHLDLGKGALSNRILPDYSPPINAGLFEILIGFLDRTHIYFGIGTVAIILLHIALMGIPMHILFFPAVLALVIWQGLFGMFITWRYTPKQIKKFSYLVHAQLFSGVMIGVFTYLGHALIDG